MKTLYIIGAEPELANAVRSILSPETYRIVPQEDWSDDLARVTGPSMDAILVDADLTNIQPVRLIERIRRRLPECPVLVFSGSGQHEWEEEVYLLGVRHVFHKPVRAPLLIEILERCWQDAGSTGRAAPAVRETDTSFLRNEMGVAPGRTLDIIRNFSEVLSHSLCAESLLKQFLLFIRGMLGVNRAAVFLRLPPGSVAEPDAERQGHRLRSACAIGLAPGLLEHFELSLESGIGRHLLRHGRILRHMTDEVLNQSDLRKEFDLLGAQVAIPILDRESLLGVAVFDYRLTGEPFTADELALMFHLLEQVGLAIRNIWLHDQVSANHDLMADTLGHLSCGCVVVGVNLEILHANKAARQLFCPDHPEGRPLEFGELPQVVGGRIFEALKTGTNLEPFRFRPDNHPGQVHQVTVSLFGRRNAGTPKAALLLVEDFTQIERLQKLDIEAANLRLVKLMSERLAHEIGNAIVPLSTHQQLFATKFRDPEFRTSLEEALSDGVRRVSRLVKQMLFLSRDSAVLTDSLPVGRLIEESFREAQSFHAEKTAYLQYENGDGLLIPACDKSALKHALAEIMLNALQSNPPTPQVRVHTRVQTDADGQRFLHIEIGDNGPGFTAESSHSGPEPFYSTRNVGVGLGLTVSRKIVEAHHGQLEIMGPSAQGQGFVRVVLPLGDEPEEASTLTVEELKAAFKKQPLSKSKKAPSEKSAP